MKYTISGEITDEEAATFVDYPKDVQRPKVRADCEEGGFNTQRPCPFVSCRHNNYLSVNPNGTIVLTWPEKKPEDVAPEASCSLDVTEYGQSVENPMEFTELPKYLGYTRGAAQQLEERAQRHARQIARGIPGDIDNDLGRTTRRNKIVKLETYRDREDTD